MAAPPDVTTEEPGEAGSAEIVAGLKAVANRLDELIHLQKIALLGPDSVLNFLHHDKEMKLSIPLAARDFIQRNILKSGNFYEVRLLEQLQSLKLVMPGSTVLDVGANIGNHTVFFSRVLGAGKVVAIEPQVFCNKLLARNIALNELAGVVVLNCLVGEKAGAGSILRYGAENLGGTNFRSDDAGAFGMRTLDAIVEEHAGGKVDFVKIDVEGMQLAVFAGAQNLLKTIRPPLWVELRAFKSEFEESETYLKAFGYKPVHKLGPNDFIFVPS